jgi:hypothetical protein
MYQVYAQHFQLPQLSAQAETLYKNVVLIKLCSSSSLYADLSHNYESNNFI